MSILFSSLSIITFHNESHCLSKNMTFQAKITKKSSICQSAALKTAPDEMWRNYAKAPLFLLLFCLSNRFVTNNILSDIKCWHYSFLLMILDAAFYLMSNFFGKNQFEIRIKRKKTVSIHTSFILYQELLSALLTAK